MRLLSCLIPQFYYVFESFTYSWRTWSSPIGKTTRLGSSKDIPVSSSPVLGLHMFFGDGTKVSRFLLLKCFADGAIA